jgi:hypothetical protein
LQAAKAEHWLGRGDPGKAGEYALGLRETALRYEAHKYVALAHSLLGQIAIVEGKPAEAEKQFATALEELGRHPAPLVAWKIYATLGRLRLQLSDPSSGREAFARALEIVNSMAANVSDENLRTTLMDSTAVREILAGAENAGSATSA